MILRQEGLPIIRTVLSK